ncbi:site-specific integrase [Aneurinibacillus tyrosinisolvens]|uniref:site-specific integrase n=1 Tax=Aneurinibacillus tyrosinisolvens TaxID=1443435 RepID=UPI00063F6E0C|nr:site-specific integrase [Aneurinibacillus tyrosinisolvens]
MSTVQPLKDVNVINQFHSMLKEQSNRNALLFSFGLYSGLRISDILPLTVGDVTGTHITLKEQKTKKNKKFHINDTLKEELDVYIKDMQPEDILFPSRKGNKPLTRIQAYRILNVVAAQLGLEEIGTHTLRKTFGYHVFKKTNDLTYLQKLYGHSSPAITLSYIGITQEDMDNFMKTFSFA